MIDNSKEFDLTADEIFSKISNSELLQYYIPGKGSIYKVVCPFHNERTPSFQVNLNTGRCKCFGCGWAGNSITYVMEKYRLNYPESLKVISADHGLKSFNIEKEACGLIGIPHKERVPVNIRIKIRNWEGRDTKYWNQYGVSRNACQLYNVFPISHYWMGEFVFEIKKGQLTFAYLENDKFQIYSPYLDKSKKWFNNMSGLCHGLDQLPKTGELLIINSSRKDIMCLFETSGVLSIAPTSETSNIPKDVLKDLKNRFKRIVIWFNNDQAGLKAAHKMSLEENLDFIFIPYEYDEKDISDFYKSFGADKTQELIKKLLNEN